MIETFPFSSQQIVCQKPEKPQKPKPKPKPPQKLDAKKQGIYAFWKVFDYTQGVVLGERFWRRYDGNRWKYIAASLAWK